MREVDKGQKVRRDNTICFSLDGILIMQLAESGIKFFPENLPDTELDEYAKKIITILEDHYTVTIRENIVGPSNQSEWQNEIQIIDRKLDLLQTSLEVQQYILVGLRKFWFAKFRTKIQNQIHVTEIQILDFQRLISRLNRDRRIIQVVEDCNEGTLQGSDVHSEDQAANDELDTPKTQEGA